MTKELSFEEKLIKLENIVKELEAGEVNLDEAFNKYSEAMKLAKECHHKLQVTTDKLNKILLENGSLEDFNYEEKDN